MIYDFYFSQKQKDEQIRNDIYLPQLIGDFEYTLRIERHEAIRKNMVDQFPDIKIVYTGGYTTKDMYALEIIEIGAISREKYNKALDTIEEYHKQIDRLIVSVAKVDGGNIEKWIEVNEPDPRIANILRRGLNTYTEHGKEKYKQFLSIDTITESGFRAIRGAGKQSWKDFDELRKTSNK